MATHPKNLKAMARTRRSIQSANDLQQLIAAEEKRGRHSAFAEQIAEILAELSPEDTDDVLSRVEGLLHAYGYWKSTQRLKRETEAARQRESDKGYL